MVKKEEKNGKKKDEFYQVMCLCHVILVIKNFRFLLNLYSQRQILILMKNSVRTTECGN